MKTEKLSRLEENLKTLAGFKKIVVEKWEDGKIGR
jgi:hypothetical protein